MYVYIYKYIYTFASPFAKSFEKCARVTVAVADFQTTCPRFPLLHMSSRAVYRRRHEWQVRKHTLTFNYRLHRSTQPVLEQTRPIYIYTYISENYTREKFNCILFIALIRLMNQIQTNLLQSSMKRIICTHCRDYMDTLYTLYGIKRIMLRTNDFRVSRVTVRDAYVRRDVVGRWLYCNHDFQWEILVAFLAINYRIDNTRRVVCSTHVCVRAVCNEHKPMGREVHIDGDSKNTRLAESNYECVTSSCTRYTTAHHHTRTSPSPSSRGDDGDEWTMVFADIRYFRCTHTLLLRNGILV